MDQLTRQHVTIKPGKVLVANADGTYKVLPHAGRSAGLPIDGVRPLLETDLLPGDDVVLVWQRPEEPPWILVTGGENAYAYWQGYRDAGYWGAVAD